MLIKISTRPRRAPHTLFRAPRTRLEAELLRAAVTDLGLSARAHDKVLRVARTIADLDAAERISCAHISEAINYRILDRAAWT